MRNKPDTVGKCLYLEDSYGFWVNSLLWLTLVAHKVFAHSTHLSLLNSLWERQDKVYRLNCLTWLIIDYFCPLKWIMDPPNINSSEKTMAPHSRTLAWKIPWMEEPGRLQSMGSLRVGHDWAASLLLFTFMHWRRKWQPTPVFLPGESQGRGSLVGCRLWGHTESDMTEAT